MEFIWNLPEKNKRLLQLARIGKETTEEREARRRLVRKIFRDLDVLDGHLYGFDFNTKDHIHALVNFYNDHKKVRKNLDIKIRRFVAYAYYVAREKDANVVLNDKLKYAMFG
ncbi:unnamed protein product [Caenorhabditis brenneri]